MGFRVDNGGAFDSLCPHHWQQNEDMEQGQSCAPIVLMTSLVLIESNDLWIAECLAFL